MSPGTVKAVAEVITAAGSRCIDAGIIGPPPTRPGVTRFYASGPEVERFTELANFGLDIRSLGAEIGLASAIKMCYAALTKGTTAHRDGALGGGADVGSIRAAVGRVAAQPAGSLSHHRPAASCDADQGRPLDQ